MVAAVLGLWPHHPNSASVAISPFLLWSKVLLKILNLIPSAETSSPFVLHKNSQVAGVRMWIFLGENPFSADLKLEVCNFILGLYTDPQI